MKNKTVLVTGAQGFLGRNVAKYFKEKGWKVFGIGLGQWKKREAENWGIDKWIETEITIDSLRNLDECPDIIVHSAGSGSVAYSISHPEEDYKANVSSIVPVLDFIRSNCPGVRLIYPSSVAVYGNVGDFPIKEDLPLKPVSPYGQNKKVAEEVLESYSKKYNENISIIRFFSLYGPGLRKQLLWDACEKIKDSKGEIIFYGKGDETRDWLNAMDASSLIYKMAQSQNKFEIINGASGNRTEIKEVLDILIKEYGKKVKIVFSGESKKGDPKHYWADITKTIKTGWEPKVELNAGIREYIRFYKENL